MLDLHTQNEQQVNPEIKGRTHLAPLGSLVTVEGYEYDTNKSLASFHMVSKVTVSYVRMGICPFKLILLSQPFFPFAHAAFESFCYIDVTVGNPGSSICIITHDRQLASLS